MSNIEKKRPVVLCILDGWGHRKATADNAIAVGKTPVWDRLVENCPNSLIETSGLDVGLSEGQMGNSEVGHTNIGAGRIVMQDLPRIDAAVADGSLADNEELKDFIHKLKQTKGVCHLMGLVSTGGVHSHQKHILALAHIIADAGIPVAIHAFLDGRDTPPDSGKGFVDRLLADIRSPNIGVAVVSGRYYAMDRDNRWERVSKAYDAIVDGKGLTAPNPIKAIEQSYAKKTYDEFVLPTVIAGYKGMNDGDGFLMANFRSDRAREITSALADPDFDGFKLERRVSFATCAGLTEYSSKHNSFLKVLFSSTPLNNILGQIVSENGKTQLRIAETEKYAHVTFFFNGGKEDEFKGEERILIPSPKVSTYDLKPEMSAPEITEKLTKAIRSDKFDLIIVNFANGDMVGHTGIMKAAVKAVETIDECLERLENAVKETNAVMLIIADHGNCEMMKDPKTGGPHTAHTVGSVPAVLVNAPTNINSIKDGRLADIAPTLLELLELPKPEEMTGKSILER
ncbi:MAG: 2,3-bisphosphoglycerate-independent phosphoglycerate mutase [Alphaproteobacteria bacterium]|nr:2,3-bisphosphoglycerate-independent phosphoglycerate mutase [Alphaproteobacteria bacterium]